MKIINVDKMLSQDVPLQFGGKVYTIKSSIPCEISDEFIQLNEELLESGFLIDIKLAMKFLKAITHCLQRFGNEVTFEELKKSNISIHQIMLMADIITRLIWFDFETVFDEEGGLKNLERLLKKVPQKLLEQQMKKIIKAKQMEKSQEKKKKKKK